MKKILLFILIVIIFSGCTKDDLNPKTVYEYTDTTYAISGTPNIFNEEIFCIYPYKSIIIDATVNDTSATYLWHPNGETTPSIEISEETNGINLYVEINSGIEGNIQIFVTVVNWIPVVYVPTSFTPFDNAINDNWRPVLNDYWNNGITGIYYEIRDNEGVKLFSTDDEQNPGWDGTYKGIDMPSGFYLYYINYTTLTSENNILTGSLELIR